MTRRARRLAGSAAIALAVSAAAAVGTRAPCLGSTVERLALAPGAPVRVSALLDRWGCIELRLTTVGRPGDATGTLHCLLWGGQLGPLPFAVRVAPGEADRDRDGYPDAAELTSVEDRTAFRRWFAAVAAAQRRAPCPCWDPRQRDCAGLVRFAFREALRTHDAAWLARIGRLDEIPDRDVERLRYPDLPVLGDRPFRVRGGPYRGPQDFDAAPTAQRLVAGSLQRLPDGGRWETGDLLYFSDPVLRVDHLMIVAGDGVVYHTGRGPDGAGEVRFVALRALERHADPQWRPQPSNPTFRGPYRWRILTAEPP